MTATLACPLEYEQNTHYSLNTKQVEVLRLDACQPSSPTFTAKQVSELAKVPLAKVYAIRKSELRPGHHYTETLNANHCKTYSFSTSALTTIELSHWLKIGKSENWSQPRLEAFRQASLWMEANGYV